MKRLAYFVLAFVGVIASVFGFGTAKAEEARYALDYVQGGSKTGVITRTIEYASADKSDYYQTTYKSPSFKSNLTSACAVDVGGNILVYYDRIYPDLVPDYSYVLVFGKFSYGMQNEGVDNMFASLYTLMGTNEYGTTVQGFKDGMVAYASGKGRSISFSDASGSHYNVNIEALKEHLRQDKLAVIFLDTFSITTSGGFSQTEGKDTILYDLYNGCHTMLVYGYRDYYYYDAAGNLIDRDTYLMVFTGFVAADLAYIYIDDYCTIDEVFTVNLS